MCTCALIFFDITSSFAFFFVVFVFLHFPDINNNNQKKMYSPSRVSSLNSRLVARENYNRSNETVANNRSIQSSISGADSAMTTASDTLRRVDAQALIGQRDIANISVEAQRALAARDSRLAETELQLRDQHNAMQDLETQNATTGQQLATARRRLADMQVSIDQAAAQVNQSHNTLSDIVRKVENGAAAFDTLVNAEKNERRDLENRIAQQEKTSRRIQDEIKVAIAQRGPAATAHSERVADTRRRLDALRRDIENKKTELGSIVTALDDLAKQNDESQRAFAKSQEEKVQQYITDRRAKTQEHNGQRQESERQLRSQTEAMADDLRSRAAALSDQIASMKDAESKSIQREMELHDAIALGKEKLVGRNALEARLANADSTLHNRHSEVRQLEEDCAAAREKTAQLSHQITAYENSLAPLPDVEASVRQLNNQVQGRQQEVADRSADHALWMARFNEQFGHAKRNFENSLQQIDEKKHRRDQTENDIQLETSTVKEQVKILEDQLRNVDLELQEGNHRNDLADKRLQVAKADHDREEAEARRRKETARHAAAQLLASLSE